MLNCRLKGSLVLVCLACIWRSNDHYGKAVSMGVAHRVRECPRDEKEWQKASDRLNCSSGVLSTMNKYHCLPSHNLTTLLEFCYNRTRINVVEGHCVVLVEKKEKKHILNTYDCGRFKEGCPYYWYFSDEIYKVPACFEIDPLQHCYKAEATCQPTTWSVTVLSYTTQSTLVNKTSTNATTAETNDSEIDALPILLSLIGILGITVIIAIVAWKNRRRRKSWFGFKEISQPEGDDVEFRPLKTKVNENGQLEGNGEESKAFDTGPIEISQPEGDDEELRLLRTKVNENGQNEGNVEESGAFETGPVEISQPEGDDEELRLLRTKVNENGQNEGNVEESRAFETGPVEISQPEGDDEELRLLRTKVNDIDRLGIDYLRNLPRDHKTFPMIAEKLKIPQEILYWNLENREKFIKSMNVGNISVFNGRAMVIGCARAGKTTLVKKIKGDKDLTTTSTSGIEIHSHAFKLNSDESTIIVTTDEEKEKGCLCLAPGMLNILEENTQETSLSVNVNVIPGQSIVTSAREEDNVVDVASRLPSSTEGTLNSNNDEVVDDTDSDVENSIKPVNNLASNVNRPREENNVVNNASNLPSSTKGTLNSHSDKAVNDTDPDVDISIQPVKTLASAVNENPGTGRSYATLEQNVDLNDCMPSVNMDNLKMLTLLDFAGQSAYYACHHIFFSPRAFFILVVDMTKELSSVATEACTNEGLIYSNWTYADYIKYWLGSIHTYSSKAAPVILAFSHSEDNGADPEKALQYFRKICECLPRKLLNHFDKRRIFSFEKLSDKNVEAFKECLAATVKSQSHWGESVPISWTKLEAVLKKLKESSNVISFSNLLKYFSETNDRKRNKEEYLLNALMFFNDTGVILFRPEIKDIIILDVQWLVDAFKRIIFDKEHMEAIENTSDIAKLQELNEHGLLSSEALNVLWRKSNFYKHRDILLDHMKQLDMLAELPEEMWYVPCMNKQQFDSTILDNCNVSSRLCFLFEFLPFVIYHRLVVACINKMEMKPRLNTKSKCFFHKETILNYNDDTHRVLIALCDNKESLHRDFPYSIEIQINVTKPREIDTRITSIIKELVCQNLNVLTQGHSSCEIYSQIGYRCRLEQFGKDIQSHIIKDEEMLASEYDCPKCNQSHIVDVQSIRRFWEGKAHPTDSNSEKEERDIKSRYPPLVPKSTIKVPGMYNIRHISVVSPDKLWVSDEDTLKQLDGTGHVLRTLDHEYKYNNDDEYEYWNKGGGHTVSVEGDLVFIAGVRNSVQRTASYRLRIQYGIHKMSSDGSITTLLTPDLLDLSPMCIHSSHTNGDLLIGFFSYSYPRTGRVMRCDGTGRKIKDIELDEEGQRLYECPDYITQNKLNGDIVVSDVWKRALVVVDRSGRHRFDYTGHSTDKFFCPYGVCTDLLGRILVIHTHTEDTDCISLLDHEGRFLTRILTESGNPNKFILRSLCVDDKNNIYVAYQDKIKVFR
uniref:Uncharacterized protein LOC111114492 isoform X2 n=1 Tax=Crassostrea virginica TaxID=6565 RepID=A0A8B8C0B4_CRAVI|nr:uncharacterized protein LOC111114492 isoform X2 [Crassostrea virginica]